MLSGGECVGKVSGEKSQWDSLNEGESVMVVVVMECKLNHSVRGDQY